MKAKSMGFIGGGRITKILLQAFANKDVEFQSIIVFDTNVEVLKALKQQFPYIEMAENLLQAASEPIVFIALHPPVIMETLDKIAGANLRDVLIISLAPKITIER